MNEVDDILGVQPAVQRQARAAAGPIAIGPRRLERCPTSRRLVNNLRASSAIAALDGLPGPGETWHCLMDGSYDSFDLIAAVLHHAAPMTIQELNLATLGFNFANMQALLLMLDRGQVSKATMIVSCWYESDLKEVDVCSLLSSELERRGGWYAAERSHAKVQLMEMADGRCYVVESSANLRTCRSIEQFTITNDRDLLRFHRQWMSDVYAASRSSRHRQDHSPSGLRDHAIGPEDGMH